MALKDVRKWNKIASAVYTIGVWTIIGSLGYFYYTNRDKINTHSARNEEENAEERENLNTIVYETAHNKTIIIYKKDFVPYTTRMYNFFQSFTGGPGTGNG
ncbi:small integral membrane protein 26-like [Vanacampus margaritifer]